MSGQQSAEPVKLTSKEAFDLVVEALQAAGANDRAATATARSLIAAECDGQRGHGLSRVSSYCAQVEAGKINPDATPTAERISNAACIIDADFGFAYPAIDLAIGELTVLARTEKIAAAAIKKSHHFGQAGAHVERLAEQGFVALLFGNSPKAIAFWGGASPMMGTNPIAFAAPVPDGAPLVIDLALSVSARGKIMAAAKAGEAIPEGWALDKQGRPTTDAKAALEGSMLPLGGAKGAALALMVEVLAAALTGSHFGFEASSFLKPEGPPPNVGCLFVAIDAEALSGGSFAERMATLIAAMGDEEGVRLPGSRRLTNRAAAERDGLFVSTALLSELQGLAGR